MSVYDGLFLLDGLQENEKREIISALPDLKRVKLFIRPKAFAAPSVL